MQKIYSKKKDSNLLEYKSKKIWANFKISL